MKPKLKDSGFVKEPNGTWSINTFVKIDGEYRHFKKRGYKSLKDAQADFERAKNEFIRIHLYKGETMTFEELVKDFDTARKLIVSDGTQYMCMSIINNYIAPFFKNNTLDECFDKEVIKRWHTSIVNDTALSSDRKNKIITAMKELLKHAYSNEYIDAKSYQSCDVRLIRVKKEAYEAKEKIVWSLEELNQFLKAIPKESNDYVMFKLFFACSPRISEFLALMPKCFNPKTKKLSIEQQICCSYNNVGKSVLTKRLKTNVSYRDICLSDELCEMLSTYIAKEKLKEDDFLFYGNSKKVPLPKTNFRRLLYHYCNKAGVRKINPHGARHTMAVLLSSVAVTGQDIEAAAKRLGHTPEMFMNTYANHKIEEKETELFSKIKMS